MLASVLNNPDQLRPGQRPGRRKQALKERYHYVARRHGRDRQRSPPSEARRRPSGGCRRSRRSRREDAVRRPEGPRAADGPRASCSRLGLHRARRSTAAACEVTTTFTEKAMDGRRGRRAGAAGPTASATSSCTSARRLASSPAPARCAASTPARTTSSPRSTGRSPAARPGRRSSRSRWRPALKDGLLAQGHLRRQLAVSTIGRHRDREPGRHRLRHRRSACSRPPRTRSTPPTSTSPARWTTARRRSSTPPTTWASRRQSRQGPVRASRATTPGLEPNDRRRARLADGEPDQHGQRLRHHRQRRRGGRAVHHREGRRRRRRRRATTTRSRTTRRSARTSPPTSPTRCSRSSRPAPARPRSALGRPAAGKTGTATNDRRRGVVVVVRRLHPAAARPR